MRQRDLLSTALLAAVCVMAACGSPTGPQPPPPPPPPPPANALPSIDGITAQGRQTRQPARFANIGETIDVGATVRDAETAVDELVYQWTATAGSFSGTGRNVTWTAPASATTPANVTLTLKVIENYGHPGQARIYSQEVTSTVAVALHDSVKEVGDMAVRFLTEFSKPQTNQDWRDVMRDFDLNGGVCADPGEVGKERSDVENHYTNFVMQSYAVGPASVAVDFQQGCFVPDRGVRAGEACARVPVSWTSTDKRNGRQATTSGTDYVAAAYSRSGARWYLCSSDFLGNSTIGHAFYSR